jgi:hypothetical protein
VDTISSGSDREPRRAPGGLAYLAVTAVILTAIAAALVLIVRDHGRRAASPPVPGSVAMRPLLTGVPVRTVQTQLVLGGGDLWRVGAHGPQTVASGLLSGGRSPFVSNAAVSQVAPVAGGVVAVITDVSSFASAGSVLFLPAASTPPRVLAAASLIAVAPGGQRVWLQQGHKRGRPRAATLTSPTWAVNLAGRRVTPVLHLPFGLVAATGSGLIIQSAPAYRVGLWSTVTGRALRPALPQDILAAEGDRIVWQPVHCMTGPCPLQVTDLRTGRETTIQLPENWVICCGNGGAAAFGASGQRLALTLYRSSRAGAAVAQGLFVVDTASRTVTGVPGGPLPMGGDGVTAPAVQMAAAWDRHGLLWVLATSSTDNAGSGYYQLGYWTGAGPLHTFPPARGSPTVLSAPGPG